MSENTIDSRKQGFDAQQAGDVPRIVDPGGEGWAQEPKVTSAELLLYGDRAGVVRLLGQGAVAAGDAYSLACKRAQEPSFVSEEEAGRGSGECSRRCHRTHVGALLQGVRGSP